MTIRKTTILCLACALAAGCGREAEDSAANEAVGATTEQAGTERRSIGDALAQSVDHKQFMEAATAAGLAETLHGAGPYTVFAPTDAAFAALPEETRSGLAETGNRESAVDLLRHHIVPGTVTAEDLRRAIERGQGGRAELATMTGRTLMIAQEGGAIVLSDGAGQARVVQPDHIYSNGVVHGIDAVLTPGAE